MQESIALEVVAAVSEKGFSLDELVFRTREVFEREGLAGFVSLVLQLVDEKLCLDLSQGKTQWNAPACCEDPRYRLHGRSDRRFRTTVGVVRLRWRRLRCQCGKLLVPLRTFLSLDRWQSKTSELEKLVAEVVSEQSYRRTSSHLDLIGDIPVPRSTLHRWVMGSECDEIDGPDDSEQELELILADATRYKRRPAPSAGKDNKGELQMVIGVTPLGQVKPLGAWSETTWEEIGKILQGKEPLGQILLTDGDRGLVLGMEHLAHSHQRCHWHLVHDLDRVMYQEDASLHERRKTQKSLAATIEISLPKEDFETVAEEDKESISKAVRQADRQLRGLVMDLTNRGYGKSARYIENARSRLFTYVDRWLKYGLVCPRASSLIERMMREIARRLKRIAFGWSESGAAKMTRIIIKRTTSAGQWEEYWKKRLGITGNVILAYRGAKVLQPTLGR
jgi:hypothetical protein